MISMIKIILILRIIGLENMRKSNIIYIRSTKRTRAILPIITKILIPRKYQPVVTRLKYIVDGKYGCKVDQELDHPPGNIQCKSNTLHLNPIPLQLGSGLRPDLKSQPRYEWGDSRVHDELLTQLPTTR